MTNTAVHPEPIAPTDARTAHILGLLEHGFFTDSKRFHQLQADMEVSLSQARDLGFHEAIGEEWGTRLDSLEQILSRITTQLTEMDEAIASEDKDRLTRALASWSSIQAEDSLLVDALNDLRTQALELDALSQQEWSALAQALAAHVETIHSCAQAFRAKLELLSQHSKSEVDSLVQKIIDQLPSRANAAAAEAEAYAIELHDAAVEIHEEQSEILGLMDTFKTMFMWMESPEERLAKNRVLNKATME